MHHFLHILWLYLSAVLNEELHLPPDALAYIRFYHKCIEISYFFRRNHHLHPPFFGQLNNFVAVIRSIC